MTASALYHRFQRYRTLRTNRITALPILILMPHSACNCRCVMCDIWKGNAHARQLTEKDLVPILSSIRKLGTRQVLMSGGEALLHTGFFQLCRLLKKEEVQITLLSTGLLLKKHAEDLLSWIDDIIVSLDGYEDLHDRIRRVPGAYAKLHEGVSHIKEQNKDYRITARSVIHQLNFQSWPQIIKSAMDMGLDGISFLPADVSSEAFNREIPWSGERRSELALPLEQLPEMEEMIERITIIFEEQFRSGFIAESPKKLRNIHRYYGALQGIGSFPYKRCNAPWVSAVIEPDGAVRPCFFHKTVGNIHEGSFEEVLNGAPALAFRRELDMDNDLTCRRCVCSLHLPAGVDPVSKI